jgi:hypothetical protein
METCPFAADENIRNRKPIKKQQASVKCAPTFDKELTLRVNRRIIAIARSAR